MSQDPIKALLEQLTRLPGVGERTALRLALHLLSSEREAMRELSRVLLEVSQRVHECKQCFALTCDDALCSVCRSHSRDAAIVCVVATVQDHMAIESTGEYRGHYHVLHGVLAPMEGKGPAELRLLPLVQRLTAQDSQVRELIIATPPTIEGEATAIYLAEQLITTPLRISRIASGVPVGGDLQFADRVSLSRALSQRRGF